MGGAGVKEVVITKLTIRTNYQLTDISTGPLHNTSSIRYHTTEQSNWHHYIDVGTIQVDCSIIVSSVSEKWCTTSWNHHPIREEPLSSSGIFKPTTWHLSLIHI